MRAVPDSRSFPGFRRRGLTMIELTVVVLIIGIITAVAAPRFAEAMVRYRADAAAKRVAADLNFARRIAKTSGKSQAVTFSLITNSYGLPGVTDLNHSSRTYSVDLTETGYPATLVSVSFGKSGMDTMVTFDRYGRPDAGGSVVVQSGSEQRTINLDAMTGKASIS